jgi:hypothetical protein
VIDWPRHPDRGYGAVQHEGEGLYVSVGMGMHLYNGDLVTSDRGLDRAQGLPAEYRGYIVDLTSSYGELFALLQGEGLGTPQETVELDLGGGDDALSLASAQSNSLVMVWNGRGWHHLWHASGQLPTNVVISQADDTYRLWWGAAGRAHAQDHTRTYFNPRDQHTTTAFAASCDHYTSVWNWGWLGQTKILKAHEGNTSGMSATEFAEIEYRLDDEPDYQALGTVQTNGEYHFRLGRDVTTPTLPGGVENWKGIPHNTVQWHYHLTRTAADATKHPVIEWVSTIARRFLQPKTTWKMTIDLTTSNKDYPPGWVEEQLMALVNTPASVPFLHRDTYHLVDVVALVFTDEAGDSNNSYAQLHLIEAFDPED